MIGPINVFMFHKNLKKRTDLSSQKQINLINKLRTGQKSKTTREKTKTGDFHYRRRCNTF